VLTHSHWIWMAALLGIWRMLMDYAIAPRVMGHELEIHPLLAIFTMMVGGAVGGIVGVYLSIPLVAIAARCLAQVCPGQPTCRARACLAQAVPLHRLNWHKVYVRSHRILPIY